MKYESPRGSEWRKWDLHLHSPKTKSNDQFKKYRGNCWDRYCEILHNSDVQVFGITDYFSADGYFNTIQEYQKRFPNHKKLFLPNVEMRTGDVVNKAREEVNVHLIFNPCLNNFKDRIKNFLRVLKTEKTESSGRHITASELKSTADFEKAVTTREFINNALADTYGKDADFLNYFLIVTAVNNNGIRTKSGKGRKQIIADELDKFSHGFFGNSGNVEHFLSDFRAEDENERTELKPVLSGCDAHSIDELEERLGNVVSNSNGYRFEPTWIKADLTFEGLKQIVFEPENRVYIGKEPEIEWRVREHATKFIKELHVTSVEGYQNQHGNWFSDEKIPIGKELVAIIGNKGSGKSAVTDIIGLLGNSHHQTFGAAKSYSEQLFSFLNRKKFLKQKCAQNFEGKLFWHEGEADCKNLYDEVNRNLPEKVEYLPQKYLERICTNIADDEFRTTLNEVVFRYVERDQRFGQNNLDDLIRYLTQQEERNLRSRKQNLRQKNREVAALEKKLIPDYFDNLQAKISQKEEERNAHKKTKPAERQEPPVESDESEKIDKLTQKIEDCSKKIAHYENEKVEITKSIEDLRQLKQAIESEARKLTDLESQYQAILKSAGLSFKDIVKIELNFKGLDALVKRKRTRLDEINILLNSTEENESAYLEGAESEEDQAKSPSILIQKKRLEQKRSELSENLDKPQREYQKYLRELRAWAIREKKICGDEQEPELDSLNGLKKEKEKIQSNYPEELEKAKEKRIEISREIFQLKRKITDFFNDIKQSIDSEIEKYRDDLGDYTLSIEAGLRLASSFIEEFLGYINQNRRGSFQGSEAGRAKIQEICEAVDSWENEERVFDTLHTIVDALHNDRREDIGSGASEKRDVFKQMKRQDEPVVDLYDYLFGFDYLSTKYDVKIDQKDLSELSPGERGGLLLVFYLMLDKQDIPLIIDQPEDNLDNKSVYEVLVKFIKQAKKRRQMIIVTHNPNLAVVADAEQIIHVSIDKTDGKNEFDYFSGSIENLKVNRAVVDILEGTLPAFDNRRLKYRKSTV